MVSTLASKISLLVAVAALGGCVSADMSLDGKAPQAVRAGRPTPMEQSFLTLDKNCRPKARPSAVVTRPPGHGSVRPVTRTSEAIYGPGPYRHCNGKLAPALAFEYRSKPDYRGPDSFDVRVRYSDGELRPASYAVDVW